MVGPPRVQLSHILWDCVCPFLGVECESAFRLNSRDAANDHASHPPVLGPASQLARVTRIITMTIF
jgi:hypothetical protein